jgi:hypothetical protein
MVKLGGKDAIILLDRFNVRSLLLIRPEAVHLQLMKDQIKYLTSILPRCSDLNLNQELHFLSAFGLDYSTLAAADTLELYPYLFELFDIIYCVFGQEFFESCVAVERLGMMLITTLEKGQFNVKQKTFESIAELIGHCTSFRQNIIAHDRFFEMGCDVLESETNELQVSYLVLIQKLMSSVTDDGRLKRRLIDQLEKYGLYCGIRILGLQLGNIGYLAEYVSTQIADIFWETIGPDDV